MTPAAWMFRYAASLTIASVRPLYPLLQRWDRVGETDQKAVIFR